MTLNEAQHDLRNIRAAGDTAELIWRADDSGETFMVVRIVNGTRHDAMCIKDINDALGIVNANVVEAHFRAGVQKQLVR